MKVYKLTKQDMTTYGNYQWILNEWRETSGKGELCGPGWLHYYTDPLLAVLLNSIHADTLDLRLWEAEVKGKHQNDQGLMGGSTHMRLVCELPLPKITLIQRTRFAIFCALEVYREPRFIIWASAWLDGSDRSQKAAQTAAAAAAGKAAWAAAGEAAWAAREAAWAAAWAAVEAARETARAAAGAAEAAAAAATAADLLELATLARRAIEEEIDK